MHERTFNNSDKVTEKRELAGEFDHKAPVEHDGRSPTRTGFDVSGRAVDGYGRSLEDREKWQRLLRHQEGHRWPDAKQRNNDANRRRLLQTICSKCETPKWVIDEACSVSDSLDHRFGRWYSQEIILLGLVAHLCPQRIHVIERSEFEGFMDTWDTNIDEVERMVELIDQRLDEAD